VARALVAAERSRGGALPQQVDFYHMHLRAQSWRRFQVVMIRFMTGRLLTGESTSMAVIW
jgi:hypothetical protein